MVVVFPLVPVTPTSGKASDGRPKNAAEIGPIAHRTRGTTTCAHPTSDGPLRDHGDGSSGRRGRGELVPVDVVARHAEEQRPGADLAGPVRHVGDRRVVRDRRRRDARRGPRR